MQIASDNQKKIMGLSEAITRYVADGCHISIGGFTINRNPMAAVYEIIRQKMKNLHVYAHSNGQGVDELVGAGCVAKLEIAYGGNGRFAPTCVRFRKAVQQGKLMVEDYTNYQMTLRFMAGAMGVPFLPTRSSLGTDIIDKWGFAESLRHLDPKIPNKKLVVLDNPFDPEGEIPRVVLVPAINPDVTLLHVQKADAQGTARIKGLTFADVEQATSARHVILTCEELVDTDELRADPDQNQIASFYVDAVAHVPMGAYPTACYRYYDYDPAYLNNYRKAAQDDASYGAYLKKYIVGTKNHQDLLDLVGSAQIKKIMADRRTGYAVCLDRK
jgi:glutaconate CoA-transferase subunit A